MYQPPVLPQFQPNSFYSPTFHCYTSPSFYRELLSDLDKFSATLDKAKPAQREAVWKMLFTLLGAKPVNCSKPFQPIIKTWKESPTINLLAIELLYIAISIILDKSPQINSPQALPLHPHNSAANGTMDKKNISTSPLAPLSTQQTAPQNRGRPHSLPSVNNGSSIALKNKIPPSMVNSSQMNNRAPIRVAPAANNPPPAPVAPKAEEEGKLLKQLIDLQKWKPDLDNLPLSKKQQILDSLMIVNPNFPKESSFSSLIIKFATAITASQQFIECLHDYISLLLKNGSISFDNPPPSPSNFNSPAPISSPSSISPLTSAHISPANISSPSTTSLPPLSNYHSLTRTSSLPSINEDKKESNFPMSLNSKQSPNLQPRLATTTKGGIITISPAGDSKRKLGEIGEVENSPTKSQKY